MTLRINHNSSSINTYRNLVNNTEAVEKTFEKVSSGLKINRAADGPASLVISERLRSQISSIEQAMQNTETDISVLQTAEASLDEINRTLVNLRQLAIHAANEGANDPYTLEADQKEVEESLRFIDRIARNTAFGNRKLLDGSAGVSGITTNNLLEFVAAGPETKESATGYEVFIEQAASRSVAAGSEELSEEIVADGERLQIIENGRTASYTTNAKDNLASIVSKLNAAVQKNGLDVTVGLSDNDKLIVRHNKYGSKHNFTVTSSTEGILSDEDGNPQQALLGKDIIGTINGEAAEGEGQILRGAKGSPNVDGLSVRYLGDSGMFGDEELDEKLVGVVNLNQNSLIFQTGHDYGHVTKVTIGSANTDNMGKGVSNASNFQKLGDINVMTHEKASDSMLLIDDAINWVTGVRGKIGAVQKNDMEAGLRNLRVYRENLVNAESIIRDTDYADEIANLNRQQIIQNASMAMMVKTNDNLNSIMQLINS